LRLVAITAIDAKNRIDELLPCNFKPVALSQTLYFRSRVMANMPLRKKAGAQNGDKFQRGA
jgi:hypothetical protein